MIHVKHSQSTIYNLHLRQKWKKSNFSTTRGTVPLPFPCRRGKEWADKWFTNLDGRSIKLVQVLDAGAGQEEAQPTPPEMPVSDDELEFGK